MSAPSETMGSMRPEPAEFDALFTAHFVGVVRTVHFIVGDRARSEEIAQDAFVQLLQHWRKVAHYERPELWVRRVAIRDAVRERRRDFRWTAVRPLVGGGPTAADPAAATAIAIDLRAALLQLAPQQRAAAVLFYYEDRPMDEIASLLGCTTSTAWNHLRAARLRLATLMGTEVTGDAV